MASYLTVNGPPSHKGPGWLFNWTMLEAPHSGQGHRVRLSMTMFVEQPPRPCAFMHLCEDVMPRSSYPDGYRKLPNGSCILILRYLEQNPTLSLTTVEIGEVIGIGSAQVWAKTKVLHKQGFVAKSMSTRAYSKRNIVGSTYFDVPVFSALPGACARYIDAFLEEESNNVDS